MYIDTRGSFSERFEKIENKKKKKIKVSLTAFRKLKYLQQKFSKCNKNEKITNLPSKKVLTHESKIHKKIHKTDIHFFLAKTKK
jgi:hypothetical protein